MDPRSGLDYMEKRNFLPLPVHELRPLGRPVRNQRPSVPVRNKVSRTVLFEKDLFA